MSIGDRFSIGARATAAACMVSAAALIVGAVMLLVVLERTLVSNVDDAARTRAQDVAAMVAQGPLSNTVVLPGRDEAVVQVVDANRQVLAASRNIDSRSPIADFRPAGRHTTVRTLTGLPIEDERADDFRVVALAASGAAGPVTVYSAASLERTQETVAAVRKILLIGLPVLFVVLVGTSRYVVGRALRPVERMRRDVDSISARDLRGRVPEPPVDDELGRLARTMNQMLERLQSFTDRQRRFVTDASHELQSPLASSLADLEVALAHPEAADWRETAAEVVADNQRMSRLVQDLLFLARANDAGAVARRAPVDLDDVVRVEAERVRTRSGVPVDVSHVSPVEVRGNGEELARVVRNLLDNATRYARSTITVELTHDSAAATLVVADDGPGVPPGARDQVFERFARSEESRSRDTGGAGLGLAIAREIAEGHRGSITLDPDGQGARFVVRLPTGG